jgi:hypothetical protein
MSDSGPISKVIAGLAGLAVAVTTFTVTYLSSHRPGKDPPPAVQPLPPETRVPAPLTPPNSQEKPVVAALPSNPLILLLDNPDSAALSDDWQQKAEPHRAEYAAYVRLSQETQQKFKPPHLTQTEAEYAEVKSSLDSFTLPAPYADRWQQTQLNKRIQQLRTEFAQVDDALKRERVWIDQQIKTNLVVAKKGNTLYVKLLDAKKPTSQETREWNQASREQLEAQSPNGFGTSIPGTRMTYGELERFEPMRTAQKNWNASKDELRRLSALIERRLK